MARSPFHFRTVCALVGLGLLAAIFARAGFWQLDRAQEREAIAAEITAASQGPPIALHAGQHATDLPAWHQATATGTWQHEYTVLIENRNHRGQPGHWVATPLKLADDTAVTVLRGWLPRSGDASDDLTGHPKPTSMNLDKLARYTGTQSIEGELFPHVPKIFELWSWSTKQNMSLPDSLSGTHHDTVVVQNLSLQDYASATGLNLLPVVLAQHGDRHSGLVQEWEHPSTDSSINKGYALQWFGFCAIAVTAWLALFWRGFRTSLRKDTS